MEVTKHETWGNLNYLEMAQPTKKQKKLKLFLNCHPRMAFQTNKTNFTTNSFENVHPVSGAGIQTRDLLNISLFVFQWILM